MARITNADDTTNALTKICEDNPYALGACWRIIEKGEEIYPYLNGWEYIKILDNLNIYGSDIDVLWRNICERDINKMIDFLFEAKISPCKEKILKNLIEDNMPKRWFSVTEKLPDTSDCSISDIVSLQLSVFGKKFKFNYICCVPAFYDRNTESWHTTPSCHDENFELTPIAWRKI